ncbi:MAG: hypothetical protein UR66_C0016G0015 [Candidatus Moranbacteria bacterium GW2011_GWE1_35_17]|nr:MAG: hypothetical protein UR66_C0016G0015 [Candidatus Moranbacteria bacterium GW2011_GWE1_35_17]KKP69428.1 MAG: hypothetical protein UR65_C0050G0009 [Candidatus Moranbacteria bacterium GW2011_GWE2_35_164]KKP82488.1 MAG: hypothetical protein UR82_C0038G0014 [Candidatus Moranbacteria bacterium GW2011_GWF1_35_5]KKP84318.1 MAG: hypothetical protein UR83_C0023G0008 [Candidatus Moranbacteria bacterium GW2011_GWF2_35_54]
MREIHNLKTQKVIRKKLRSSATPQEIILWSRLKGKRLGCKFRRQQSFGKYIVDFYCPEKNLVIELDGWQHKEQIEYDNERSKFLESLNLKIIRFWNNDINNNLDSVILEIEKYL